MSTYIMLFNFTEQGIKNIKDAPKRKEAAEKLASDLGGSVVGGYLTLGGFDRVAILDMPDDAAAAKFALSIGMAGNAKTTTLKAFGEGEGLDIIASL